MADLLDINLTNDTKNAFVLALRTVYGSNYLVEYQYSKIVSETKILIHKSFPLQPEKKPAIIISAAAGTTHIEHHNEEEIGEHQNLSNTQVATSDPQRGNDIIINIADTTGFVIGGAVMIVDGEVREQAIIIAVDTNVSITVDRLENNYTTPAVSLLTYVVDHYGGQKLNVVITIYALSDLDRNRLADFTAFSLRYLFRNTFRDNGIGYNKIEIGADSEQEIRDQLYYTKAITVPVYTEYQADVEVPADLINLISRINFDITIEEP